MHICTEDWDEESTLFELPREIWRNASTLAHCMIGLESIRGQEAPLIPRHVRELEVDHPHDRIVKHRQRYNHQNWTLNYIEAVLFAASVYSSAYSFSWSIDCNIRTAHSMYLFFAYWRSPKIVD